MLKEKLNSQSGATLLLALLFFLICAVAGSVVLAAGSTAAGRIAGLQEQEQTYYTVSSAAKVVCQEINNKQLIIEEADKEGNVSVVTEPDTDVFKNMLDTLTEKNYLNIEHKGNNSLEAQMTVNPVNAEDKKTFGTVYGDVSMDSKYGLLIKLYLKDADDKRNDTYICTVTSDALVEESSFERADSDDSSNSHTITQVKVTWNNTRIEKGN